MRNFGDGARTTQLFRPVRTSYVRRRVMCGITTTGTKYFTISYIKTRGVYLCHANPPGTHCLCHFTFFFLFSHHHQHHHYRLLPPSLPLLASPSLVKKIWPSNLVLKVRSMHIFLYIQLRLRSMCQRGRRRTVSKMGEEVTRQPRLLFDPRLSLSQPYIMQVLGCTPVFYSLEKKLYRSEKSF